MVTFWLVQVIGEQGISFARIYDRETRARRTFEVLAHNNHNAGGSPQVIRHKAQNFMSDDLFKSWTVADKDDAAIAITPIEVETAICIQRRKIKDKTIEHGFVQDEQYATTSCMVSILPLLYKKRLFCDECGHSWADHFNLMGVGDDAEIEDGVPSPCSECGCRANVREDGMSAEEEELF